MCLLRFQILFCLTILSGINCSESSSTLTDGAVKYTCIGSSAIFPWSNSFSQDGDIIDVKWFFQAAQPGKKVLVAILANDLFLPSPSYAQRVSFVPSAGIALSHVTLNDTGNYSMEMTGHDSSGGFFQHSHDSFLQVTDGWVTRDSNLHARQEKNAVYNNATGVWSLDVVCGTFLFVTNKPPFDVLWLSPSGTTMSSSHYDNGEFHLLLSLPVANGTYTCQMPDSMICLHGNSTQAQQASVTVDDTKARLTVLESKIQDCNVVERLNNYTNNISQQNALLQQENTLLAERNSLLDEKNTNLILQLLQLAKENIQLSQRLNTLANQFSQFQDTYLTVTTPSPTMATQQCCITLNDIVQKQMNILDQKINHLTQQFQDQKTQMDNVSQDYHDIIGKFENLQNTLEVVRTGELTMKESVDVMKSQITSLEGKTSVFVGKISFHARMKVFSSIFYGQNCRIPRAATISFQDIIINEGNGFDSVHSRFTAPVNGTYFFMASIASRESAHAGIYLMLGPYTELDYIYLHSEQEENGYVHAVVHLSQGEYIWVKNHDHDSDFRCQGTVFSGFILNRD